MPALEQTLSSLTDQGMRMLLAHPERCPGFQREPKRLGALVRAGALTSVTAGAFVGRFGRRARDFALELARGELIHSVASDAHDRYQRPPGLRTELREAGMGALEEWLTVAVPRAILDGDGIPARPSLSLSGPAAGRGLRRWRVSRAARRR
jgi:protein-tyrosine phosphatase